jgi:signal transduction histidine kinase
VGDLGVLTVIDSLAKEVCLRTGASYELASDIATGIDSEMLTDPKLATVVFRVVQEAMSNIERHAEASRVDITVEARFGCLTVVVRDNGRGIANYQLSGEGTLGILGMRERAAAIGGEVSVEGFPGKGTAVTLRVADLRAQESGAGTQISRAHG